jgi:hypothetical protein
MKHLLPSVGIVTALLGLTACGSNTKVTLELTDAPPDTSAIAHVFVSLERVEVHVAGSDESEDDKSESKDAPDTEAEAGGASAADDGPGGWRTVAAKAGTFDLVALQNDVRATLGELDLPSGKITQIRLFIDGAAKNEVVLTTGASCPLDLSNVPPTGIKIIHPFKALDVSESSKLTLVVDFDLSESLDQAAACSFTLNPVIKLKSVEKG